LNPFLKRRTFQIFPNQWIIATRNITSTWGIKISNIGINIVEVPNPVNVPTVDARRVRIAIYKVIIIKFLTPIFIILA
jgi:hypothetical protein